MAEPQAEAEALWQLLALPLTEGDRLPVPEPQSVPELLLLAPADWVLEAERLVLPLGDSEELGQLLPQADRLPLPEAQLLALREAVLLPEAEGH